VVGRCGGGRLLAKLGLVLFEQLGEEYPDTLGSIIAAEGAIANVVGMTQMNPLVEDPNWYKPNRNYVTVFDRTRQRYTVILDQQAYSVKSRLYIVDQGK